MSVVFLSDLHLDPERPDATRRFLRFLERDARGTDGVYILGDLFEAWIGDDDDEPALTPIVAAIAELTGAGVPCHFMHGNRDFLVGERFAAATGVTLLDEFTVADLYGERVLLTHGDLLCTDDTRYLSLRGQLRDPAWQRGFLAKPLPERRRIAAELRALSKSEMSTKPEEIMDVNDTAVADAMRRFDVRAMIHGHTHRPAIHRFSLDGQDAVRIVLDDWYEGGGFLAWDADGPRACALVS